MQKTTWHHAKSIWCIMHVQTVGEYIVAHCITFAKVPVLKCWKKIVFCLLRSLFAMSGLRFLKAVFIAPACSRVRYRRPIFRPSVHLSTFMSTYDIYVKVSILINYKTKQPSNLAWNISLTSWLCDIGIRFLAHLSWKLKVSFCDHSPSVVVVVIVVRMSVRPSVHNL